MADILPSADHIWSEPKSFRAAGADIRFAEIADDVYGAGTRGTDNWRPLADWQSLLLAGLPAPRALQASLDIVDRSGFFARLYRVGHGPYVLAFRGTEDATPPTSIMDALLYLLNRPDLRTDMEQARGRPTVQYLIAVVLTEIVSRRFHNLILTGHSLGGGLAQFAASWSLTRRPTVIFNAAGLTMHGPNFFPGVVQFRMADDWVSQYGKQLGEVISLPADKFYAEAAKQDVRVLKDKVLHAHVGSDAARNVIAALTAAYVDGKRFDEHVTAALAANLASPFGPITIGGPTPFKVAGSTPAFAAYKPKPPY